MIRFAAVLVVVALGVLVGGAVSSELSLVYLAVVLSAVALVALGLGVVLNRKELFGNRPGLVPAGAGTGPAMPVGPAGQDQASPDRTVAPVPPRPVVPAAAEPGVAGVAPPTVPSPVITDAASTGLFAPRPVPARPVSWAAPQEAPADALPAEATAPAPSEWFDRRGQPVGSPSGDTTSAAPLADEQAPDPGLPSAEPPTRAVPVLSEAAVTRATPVLAAAAAAEEASPVDDIPLDDTAPADQTSSTDEAADADPAGPAAADVTAVTSDEPAAEADHPAVASVDKDADAGLEAEAAPAEDLVSPADEPGETPAEADSVPAPAAGLVTLIRGVLRYHQPECVLIRFMSDEDIQKLPVSEARAAGCTPCSACQPAEA